MTKRWAKYLNWYVAINAVLLFIACRGICVSFFMNGVNRSLWIDEAFLASSFSKRSFWGIFLEGEFDYLQTAPLGWLWAEKILAIVFGNTPYVLRMGSVIGFILILVLLVIIQLFVYKSKFPFAASAFLSNIPIALQYSNMFKPYIFDGFVTLLIATAYGLWKREKINRKWLAVIWMGLIWFSQTACFMIGGFCLCEFIFSCLHKDRREIIKTIFLGMAVIGSFCVYYFVWVRRMTSIVGMQNYWDSYFFPLIPKSITDIKKGIELLKAIFEQYDQAYLFVMASSAGGIFLAILKKDRMAIGLLLGIGVAIFASAIHMYPIMDRLWCFSYPVFALITFVTVEEITQKKPMYKYIAFLVLLVISLENTGYEKYSEASNVYWNNEEIQIEMDYLRNHMEPDDKVYVYGASKPAFEYINGYGNSSFGGGTDNVIFGDADFDWRFIIDAELEKEKVLSNSNIWIVSSHTNSDKFTKLISIINDNGYLELIYNPYNTPLWHYSKSLDDVKKHFTMGVQGLKTENQWSEAVIHIKNDGMAYLNNIYNDIYLVEMKTGTIYPIKSLIAPGEEVNITIRFPETEEPEVALRGKYGKIAKDDTIKITKEMIGSN